MPITCQPRADPVHSCTPNRSVQSCTPTRSVHSCTPTRSERRAHAWRRRTYRVDQVHGRVEQVALGGPSQQDLVCGHGALQDAPGRTTEFTHVPTASSQPSPTVTSPTGRCAATTTAPVKATTRAPSQEETHLFKTTRPE